MPQIMRTTSGDLRTMVPPVLRWPFHWQHSLSRRVAVVAQQAIVVGGFFLFWQLGAGKPEQGALLDELFVGRPTLIWQQTVTWLVDGTLSSNAWVTIREAVIGFVFGSMSGVAAGLILGATGIGRAILAPLVFVAYSVPRLALAPLLVLWFGLGVESKIALVTLIIFFYTFFNAYEGARQVDEDLIAVCRMMRGSRLQILLKVTVPSAMMWVAVGLKVSVPHAFGGAVVGEIIAGRMGLGVLMSRSSHALDANGLFSAALVTGLLAILLNALVARVVGFGLRWRQAGGAASAELI
jgi:NitT/TauT family transport system permease protein